MAQLTFHISTAFGLNSVSGVRFKQLSIIPFCCRFSVKVVVNKFFVIKNSFFCVHDFNLTKLSPILKNCSFLQHVLPTLQLTFMWSIIYVESILVIDW